MSQELARPYIGGQAVIEGVMMRSPGSLSVVCRRRSGQLVVRERPAPAAAKGVRSWPFVRGMVTVVESLRVGAQALHWSADIFEQDLVLEETEKKQSSGAPPKGPGPLSVLSLGIVALATQPDDAQPVAGESSRGGLLRVVPIVFAVLLLVLLPQLVAEGVTKLLHLDLPVTSAPFQAITGAAKLCIVVGYLLAIRRIDQIRRVFQYHGAEHKAISTYEAQEDLLVENARKKTTMHPRCGTTFLVMVALVSILAFTALGALVPHLLPTLPGGRPVESVVFFLCKLPFLPVIAAITFEIQRIFARYCTTGPLRALLWPGFLVQKITTIEPDDLQLEVAMASLQATLWREAAATAPAPADREFPSYADLLADPGYAPA